MTAEEKLEAATRAVDLARDVYAQIRLLPVPRTLLVAIEVGWDTEVEIEGVELPANYAYDEDERAADKTRCVSMARTIPIVGEFGAKLADRLARSRLEIWSRKIERYRAALGFLVAHGSEIVDAVGEVASEFYQTLRGISWEKPWSEILEEAGTALAVAIAAAAAAVSAGALGLAASIVTGAGDALGPSVWAQMALAVRGETKDAEDKMRRAYFLQSSGIRVWRRKETRT